MRMHVMLFFHDDIDCMEIEFIISFDFTDLLYIEAYFKKIKQCIKKGVKQPFCDVVLQIV